MKITFKDFLNESTDIDKELSYYKQIYSRYWNERLEDDFKKIIKGYPISITDFDDRNDVREEIVLPLKNEYDKIFYKAYITPEVIQQNPNRYDFVSPIWRDKDSLDWVIHHINEVKNVENTTFGFGVNLKEGGGSSLAYLFLVDYETGI